MKNVVFAVVNRNGKALLVNCDSNKYKEFNASNSQKASMLAICEILKVVGRDNDANKVATIIVPKNLNFILRKESVYNWINNGNKTKTGTELDKEFIELAKYISDMRNYLGYRVKVKMTGTIIMTPEEEQYMKQAWNLLDKVTGYKRVVSNNRVSKPVMPKSIASKLN